MIIDISTEQKREIDKLSAEHRRTVLVYATPDGKLHVRWKGDPPVQSGILIYEKAVK